MKKYFLVILTLILIFVFTGCKTNNSTDYFNIKSVITTENKAEYYSLSDDGAFQVTGEIKNNDDYVLSQKFWTNSTKIFVKNNSDSDIVAELFSTNDDSNSIQEMTIQNKKENKFTNLSSQNVYYIKFSTDTSVNLEVDIHD